MAPVGLPDRAKLDMPVFEPPKPDPNALPNPLPPRPPKPGPAFVAKGDAPAKPEDEPKPLLGLGPKEPNPEPEPGLEDVPNLPKGDFEALAKAESPDDANADDDVCCSSLAAASGSGVCRAIDGDLGDARVPKGETADVLANPEDFST